MTNMLTYDSITHKILDQVFESGHCVVYLSLLQSESLDVRTECLYLFRDLCAASDFKQLHNAIL